MRSIYLDHHATCPVLPEVLEAMLPYHSQRFWNPSSVVYPGGMEAARAVERGRQEVAALVGGRPTEVVFTSGATEADNWALKGSAWAAQGGRNHLVISAVEHPAVTEPARWLERRGFRLTVLPVDRLGRVDAAAVEAAVGDDTLLVSVQMASGEVGTVQAVRRIAEVCRARGARFHVDAAQAAGRIPLSMEETGADLLSLSAHKLYGPKGVGALVIRRGVRLEPLLHGGGQERGRRSGTVHVAGVVGFGAACRVALRDLDEEASRLASLRDRLWKGIQSRVPGVRRNGDPDHALPNNLNVSFEGVYAPALIQALRGVSVSSGSACSSTNPEPSPVLLAMGVPEALADAALRFGLGRGNTPEQVDRVVQLLEQEVKRLRALNPQPS